MREFFGKLIGRFELGVILGGIIFVACVGEIVTDWNKPASTVPVNTTLTLEYKVTSEHYTADACIVCCIDDRFTPMLKRFARQKGYLKIDWIKVAGGAKDFDDTSTVHAYLRKQIVKSLELHHTKRVDIVIHTDCGAYGGDNNDVFSVTELERIRSEIKTELHENGYDVSVVAYLATFNGLYEVK